MGCSARPVDHADAWSDTLMEQLRVGCAGMRAGRSHSLRVLHLRWYCTVASVSITAIVMGRARQTWKDKAGSSDLIETPEGRPATRSAARGYACRLANRGREGNASRNCRVWSNPRAEKAFHGADVRALQQVSVEPSAANRARSRSHTTGTRRVPRPFECDARHRQGISMKAVTASVATAASSPMAAPVPVPLSAFTSAVGR